MPDTDFEACPVGTMAAMNAMLERYVALVNSGDAGNWNPEEEDEVIKCRAILKAHRESLEPSK